MQTGIIRAALLQKSGVTAASACHINSKYHIMRIWDFLEFIIPVNLYSHVGMPVAHPVALCRQQLRIFIDIAYFVQTGIIWAVPLQRSGVTAASAPSAIGFPLRGNRLGLRPSSEWTSLCSDFCSHKNQSPASSFLLFPKNLWFFGNPARPGARGGRASATGRAIGSPMWE